MARTVVVKKNATHWQSQHIAQLVRLCSKGAGCVPEARFAAYVEWSESGDCFGSVSAGYNLNYDIWIKLPKRGRASNLAPLVQLSQSTLGKQGPGLPLHQTYRLAKRLTSSMYEMTTTLQRGSKQRRARIRATKNGVRPSWIPEDFSIQKYAPKKPAEDKRTFIEKVEDDIARAEERVEKWEAEVERVEGLLERAQRDLKKHQKRLRDAKKRRGA